MLTETGDRRQETEDRRQKTEDKNTCLAAAVSNCMCIPNPESRTPLRRTYA